MLGGENIIASNIHCFPWGENIIVSTIHPFLSDNDVALNVLLWPGHLVV